MNVDIHDWVKHHEGLRLTAYPDPKSGGPPWTIGYGHTGPEVRKGVVWTLDQANQGLDRDLQTVNHLLTNYLPWTNQLSPNRLVALQDMVFNMGMQKVLGFHRSIAAIRSGAWQDAHDFLLDSQWHKDVGHRADEDALLVLNG